MWSVKISHERIMRAKIQLLILLEYYSVEQFVLLPCNFNITAS